MYIPIERNNRGILMIDKEVINNLILFGVATQIDKRIGCKIKTWIHQENGFFCLVEFYFPDNVEVNINERDLAITINEAIEQTLNIKPKNISFAYIHQNK